MGENNNSNPSKSDSSRTNILRMSPNFAKQVFELEMQGASASEINPKTGNYEAKYRKKPVKGGGSKTEKYPTVGPGLFIDGSYTNPLLSKRSAWAQDFGKRAVTPGIGVTRDDLQRAYIEAHDVAAENAAEYLLKIGTNIDNLSQGYKDVLVDYAYQMQNNNLGEVKNVTKAIVNNDLPTIVKEYPLNPKEPTSRDALRRERLKVGMLQQESLDYQNQVDKTIDSLRGQKFNSPFMPSFIDTKLRQEAQQIVQPLIVPPFTQTDTQKFVDTFKDGGILNYDSFLRYYDKKSPDSTYNIQRAYKIYKKDPTSFNRDFATKEADGWHFPSVDPETNIFLKAKSHPSIQLEYDWYNSPEANKFRQQYKLDTTDKFPRYIPNETTTQYAEGGEITEDEKASIRAYMPTLESQAYLNREKARIYSDYGETSEVERSPIDNHITAVRNLPADDITYDVLLGATALGALGRVGFKLGKAGLQMYNKAAADFIKSAPKGADIVTPGRIGKNIDDIRYARAWNKDYGYPGLSYSKAFSTKATNDAIKNTVTRHNTFYRGTNPSRNGIAELEAKGIQKGSIGEAEYMSTHVPPNNTGAARAGMIDSELSAGNGGLYTSNSEVIAGAHTGNNGYLAAVRKPMDMSSANRRDWVSRNIDRANVEEMKMGYKDNANFIFKGPVGSKQLDVVDIAPTNNYGKVAAISGKPTGLAKLDTPKPATFMDNPAVRVAEVLTEKPKTLTIATGASVPAGVGVKLVQRYLKSKNDNGE